MSEEKKLHIVRSDSSVEITVGDPLDKEMASEDLDDKLTETEDKPDTICSALNSPVCFRPFSKTQFCVLIIIAMVMLAVALLILIVLMGLVASHDSRIGHLEKTVSTLEAENAQLLYNAEQDRLLFEEKLEQKIAEASNQFGLIYLQTLSLFSQKEELENKVELLSNKTDALNASLQTLEEDVVLLTNRNNSLNSNSLESSLESLLTSQSTTRLINLQSLLGGMKQNELPTTLSHCERVRMCLGLPNGGREREIRTCSRIVVTMEEYQQLQQSEVLKGLPLKLYSECV